MFFHKIFSPFSVPRAQRSNQICAIRGLILFVMCPRVDRGAGVWSPWAMFDSVKVCPIVLRPSRDGYDILCFRHPTAGHQFVKGTIEPEEPPEDAATRELFEESGLIAEVPMMPFGQKVMETTGQGWQFYIALSDDRRNGWAHDTLDDHGHRFTFFWQPLATALDETWHPMFHEVHEHVLHHMADAKVIPYLCGVPKSSGPWS